MRNYITCFFTRIDAFDNPYPTALQTEWSAGLTQDAAHQLCVAHWGPIYAAFDNEVYTDEGVRYLLLNRETIVGVLTSGGGCTQEFKAFRDLAAAEGLDPGTSPVYKPAVWPSSDGEKFKKGKASKNVKPETLLQALLTFAGVLVAAGFKTGGRPNLLTRLIVFIQAVKNNRPYDADALSLLLEKIANIR